MKKFLIFDLQLFCIGFVLCFLTLSCTNNLNNNRNVIKNFANSITPDNNELGNSSINLSKVVQDAAQPNTLLNILGDGSGTLGDLCGLVTTGNNTGEDPSQIPNTQTPGTSACNCILSYTSNGSDQSIQTPLTYSEQNLIKCPFDQVPNNINRLQIQVTLPALEITSNTINLTLSYNGFNLDTTNVANYRFPVRIQCRDTITIPYLWDPNNVYDPFQSENPDLTYPLDYYVSDFYTSISNFNLRDNPNGNLSNYVCPPVLSPSTFLSSTYTDNYNNWYRLNMNLYSVSPLSDGSSVIFPPSGEFNRIHFGVLQSASGVFNVPVNAFIAPTILTANQSTTVPPLGYGAASLPSFSQVGVESCPSAVEIPPGYRWVKLWLFRASLPPRTYYDSRTLVNQISDLRCNPGDWLASVKTTPSPTPTTTPATLNYQPIYPGCFLSTPNSNYSQATPVLGHSLANLTFPGGDNHFIVDRVVGADSAVGGMCVQLDPGKNTTTSPTACDATGLTANQYPVGINCALGADVWRVEIPFTTGDPLAPPNYAVGCQAPKPVPDPLNVCTQPTPNSYPAGFLPSTTPTNLGVLPISANIVTAINLDTAGESSNARYDFLYIVSPENINTRDMINSSSDIATPYYPYRYFNASDCQSANPNNPTAGDCLARNRINYGIKLHDIGQNGDPPANDPSRGGIFPICVIQPIQSQNGPASGVSIYGI